MRVAGARRRRWVFAAAALALAGGVGLAVVAGCCRLKPDGRGPAPGTGGSFDAGASGQPRPFDSGVAAAPPALRANGDGGSSLPARPEPFDAGVAAPDSLSARPEPFDSGVAVAPPTLRTGGVEGPPLAAPACPPPLVWRFPAVPRVVALGDVHGDLAATRRALRLGGVIDDQDRWTGGATWVVQTGDVLDRGDDEQAILDLFEQLEIEARAAGGRFLWLLGNHELMNPAGDLRYVTRGGFRDFEDVPGLPLDRFPDVPAPARARVAAFAPGGPYARMLAGQTVVAIVGDSAFVHGGIVPGVAATLDADQHATRCWLDGAGPPPVAFLERPDGPVWDRSLAQDDVDCAVLDRTLAELGVRRIVIGHTPQLQGITSACDGKVWRIDVGMASYYGGPTEVLELTAAGPRPLR